MKIDLDIFLEMLGIDSTSGNERPMADYVLSRLADGFDITVTPGNASDDEPVNILLSKGDPKVVFCSHLDTVPPYIPPVQEIADNGDIIIRGRGSCDAKGQIMAIYTACRRLLESGETDFGMLLLYGEETGSKGAKEYRRHPGAEFLVVGEPTDNRMAVAAKGTKLFKVTVNGAACHSGYPEHGRSAVDNFVDIVNKLRDTRFPVDEILGSTTWNVGELQSDNRPNILSPRLSFSVYFRTTFASDRMVGEVMESFSGPDVTVEALGGDTPSRFYTMSGYDTSVVAFGSDAPQLTNFRHKMLCGPGSILCAHKDNEHVSLKELEEAADIYLSLFYRLKESKP